MASLVAENISVCHTVLGVKRIVRLNNINVLIFGKEAQYVFCEVEGEFVSLL
jgi:hypothetical protein